MERRIWDPIKFDEKWKQVKTEKFDNIYPSWERRRRELQANEEQYNRFLDQIKRKQAIDTGVIERMYDLKRGITETFIKKGFVDSYLQHGDTDISPNLLMSYLEDNFRALDMIFDFVKSSRELSVSYIKELHSLITSHQDYTEAVDQFGNRVKIPMVKGEFKTSANNPSRDGVRYCYCPPEQTASEMDNLVRIFGSLNCHVLVKAAFLHHAFTQIHPFQDGNGRMARLLASFVLIKEGLFPLSVDREERVRYIDALEKADAGEYQDLVDVFADNQISCIERALNFKTVESASGYSDTLDLLGKKIANYKEAKKKKSRIMENMKKIFDVIKEEMKRYQGDIISRLPEIKVENTWGGTGYGYGPEQYLGKVVEYAKEYDYHVNSSLELYWGKMFFEIDEWKKYRMVISLHYYGYDDSTFAIGTLFFKYGNHDMRVTLGIPPLTLSSEKDVADLTAAVKRQIETSIMAVLAYITGDLTF